MEVVTAPTRSNIIRTWLRRLTENNGVTGAAFVLSFVFVGLFVSRFPPLFNTLPPPELNLAGDWDVCIPPTNDAAGCQWSTIQVPKDIPKPLLQDFQGWAIYRKHFTAPAACLGANAACAFFFEEIGDSAEGRLNGHMIGRHGQFPPHAVYAKHYPVRFQISRELLNPGPLANELTG